MGLGAIATGGGCDFIIRVIKPERDYTGDGTKVCHLVLSTSNGECPDIMGDPCGVGIMLDAEGDDGWQEHLYIPFKNVTAAMEFMATDGFDYIA